MINNKIYNNGIRLLHERQENTGIFSVCFHFLAGSKDEKQGEEGIAHFCEHMAFKSTEKYTAKELNALIDGIGAEHNACTSFEMTQFYMTVLNTQVEKSFDIMSQCLFHSKWNEEEFAKEKGVVCSEIDMYDDMYQELAVEKMMLALCRNSPYGHSILGSKETVQAMSINDLYNFRKKFYTAERLIITCCGDVDWETIQQLVDKFVLPNFTTQETVPVSYHLPQVKFSQVKEVGFTAKDTPQFYFALGWETINQSHEDRLAYKAGMTAISSGLMSSRLMQTVREENGLVYYIYGMDELFAQSGLSIILFACNKKDASKALSTTREALNNMVKNGITSAELEKVKNRLKSGIIFNRQKCIDIARTNVENLVYKDTLYDYQDRLRAIDDLTLEQVNRTLVKYLNFENVVLHTVSKENDIDTSEAFKI